MEAEDKVKLIELIREHDMNLCNLTLNPPHLNFLVSVFWPKIMNSGCTAVGMVDNKDLIPLIGGLIYRASMSVGKAGRLMGFYNNVISWKEPAHKCAVILAVTIDPKNSMLWDRIEAFEKSNKITKIFSIVDSGLGWAEEAAARGYEFEALLRLEDVGSLTPLVK